MLFNKPLDLAKLSPVESVVRYQRNRFETEFGFISARLAVNVRRFLPLIAVEKESEAPNPQYR
jgi:hypothetical protein